MCSARAGQWAVAGAAAIVLLGCVLQQASAQSRRDLRVGVGAVPAVLDPATSLEGVTPLIARQIFETLVRFREGTSDIEPALALQWNVSKDGLVWSFRLREGVRFHDGIPLAAHHVAAVFERHLSQDHPLHPNQPAVWPRLLRGLPGVVKEVKAIDAKTVQITLVLPYAPLLTVLAHPAFGVIRGVPGEKAPVRWLGTGPFRLAESAPGRVITPFANAELEESTTSYPRKSNCSMAVGMSGKNH